jgi:hypothetical protein
MRGFALNDKQMEIFRATWPNLGWAAREREEQLKELADEMQRNSSHAEDSLPQDGSA